MVSRCVSHRRLPDAATADAGARVPTGPFRSLRLHWIRWMEYRSCHVYALFPEKSTVELVCPFPS